MKQSGSTCHLVNETSVTRPVRNRGVSKSAQRGVALVVALILLVVITLLGLAAVSGTILQQRMAANQYDRSVAFQSAAAALRVAQGTIPLAGNPANTRDCAVTAAVVCQSNPFIDPNLIAAQIHTVGATAYQPGNQASGQPQYVIEDLGTWVNYESATGIGNTANSHNNPSPSQQNLQATYFRITARSGDPAIIGERAVVTLQVVIKKG